MTLPLVLAACGDVGGTNALAPVLECLVAESRVRMDIHAYRLAIDLLARRGLTSQRIPMDADVQWFTALLHARNPSLVLVATSFNDEGHEKTLVTAARRSGVPTLGLVDYWSNYRVRFADATGELTGLPDRIAVMDRDAREAAIAEGLPAESLVVTGQPALDALRQRRLDFTPRDRDAIWHHVGVEAGDLVVLFVSQALAEMSGADESAPTFLGYHEHSVLDLLIPVLERIAVEEALRIRLVIRPHARESAAPHEGRRSEVIRIVVSTAGEGHAAAMASDLVVGMTSTLLVEAAFLGCAVVSLQPGHTGRNLVPPSVRRLMDIAERREDVEAVIVRSIRGAKAMPRREPRADDLPRLATRNVVDHVYSMISGSSV